MDLAGEIEKLFRLREQGALTDAEFAKAKETILKSQSAEQQSRLTGSDNPLRNIFRSKNDRWLGGVCGGLGELTPVPSWLWRLVFCLVGMLGGFGVIAYILLWIFVPERAAS